jgi:hypothetical protein
MRTHQNIWFIIALLATSLYGSNASAQCTVTFEELSLHRAEHTSYAVENWSSPYDSSNVNTLVDWYEMPSDSWDQGWGWRDASNPDRPFGRTMNSLTLIRRSPSLGWIFVESGDQADLDNAADSEQISAWLDWAKGYSHGEIDELLTDCRGTAARTQWGPFIDNWTKLFVPFFYDRTVANQAATIVHEAHHAAWWNRHDGNGGCERGGASCDQTWHVWNANSIHVYYLFAVARSGRGLSDEQRTTAQARAITRASRTFNQPFDMSRWDFCIDNRVRELRSNQPACY